MLTEEFLGLYPLKWRNITFWTNDPKNPKRLEVYTHPACGWWYEIDLNVMTIKACKYGEHSFSVLINNHAMFKDCTIAEMIASIAILVSESGSPQGLMGVDGERVKMRMQSWAQEAPYWVREL